MAKILFVEDDATYADLVCDYLKSSDHILDVTDTVADALHYLSVYQYDLLIVDWQLPDVAGPEFISKVRNQGSTMPILMLTSREAIHEKVHGFNSGADDYLTKNTDPLELQVRVQALLRRPAVYQSQIFSIGDIEIDIGARGVKKKGANVHLLPQEFAVLECLIRNPNKMFSAEELIEKVWPSDTEATSQSVRSCINKIRAKLDDTDGPPLILTKYKAGYQLNKEMLPS
jgi:DNA-binding response OmpR family regulator